MLVCAVTATVLRMVSFAMRATAAAVLITSSMRSTDSGQSELVLNETLMLFIPK